MYNIYIVHHFYFYKELSLRQILSPYDDHNFNSYFLLYIKHRLKLKCKVFSKDDVPMKYFLDKDSKDFYTPDDIINSVELSGRVIRFNNETLVNHAVYNLNQRFWYETLRDANNIVRKLYLEFKQVSEEFEIQQRKLSHIKNPRNRATGYRR